MSLLAGFGDISIVQIGTVAAMALLASLVGGVAGYGTGVLMPLVLVPIAGAEAIVPIIAISSLFTNASRATAFRQAIDRQRAFVVLLCAAPTCVLGAYGFTLLTGRGALLVIGSTLVLSVPLRRLAKRRGLVIAQRGLAFGSALYGVLVGGTTGAGVVLLSLLMAAGLQGAAVIATDALIAIALGVMKVAVFGIAGVITPKVIAFALIIGAMAFPGAFLAKALVDRLSVRAHTTILDGVVVGGGAYMIVNALASA
ncbi:MAG: sulfite exporter TauE/SafE family protein [Variibacter sp.]|nr:sulfite exporter TauE/SafE family protein [Variibacter sp.]